MDPAIWLPDDIRGWLILGLLVFGLGWWLKRLIPRAVVRIGGARHMARQRGWLVKTGVGPDGELSPDGSPIYQELGGHAAGDRRRAARRVPRLHLPRTPAGNVDHDQRGYIGRAPAELALRLRGQHRHDLVSVRRFLHLLGPPTDPRLAAGAVSRVHEWERPIYRDLSASIHTPPKGFRSGHGLISAERRDDRLSKGILRNHLDKLLTEVQPGTDRV